jgi:hypothetical protein
VVDCLGGTALAYCMPERKLFQQSICETNLLVFMQYNMCVKIPWRANMIGSEVNSLENSKGHISL